MLHRLKIDENNQKSKFSYLGSLVLVDGHVVAGAVQACSYQGGQEHSLRGQPEQMILD